MPTRSDAFSADNAVHWDVLQMKGSYFIKVPELINFYGHIYFPIDTNKRTDFQHLLHMLVSSDVRRMHDDIAAEMHAISDPLGKVKFGGRRKAFYLAIKGLEESLSAVAHDDYSVMGTAEAYDCLKCTEEKHTYVGWCVDYMLRRVHFRPDITVSLSEAWGKIDDRDADIDGLPTISRRLVAGYWSEFKCIAHLAYADFALEHCLSLSAPLKARGLGAFLINLARNDDLLMKLWTRAYLAQQFLSSYVPKRAKGALLPLSECLKMPEPPTQAPVEFAPLPEPLRREGPEAK